MKANINRVVLFLITVIIICAFLSCKNRRVNFFTESNSNRTFKNSEIQDSIIKFHCFAEHQKELIKYIDLNFEFNTKKQYNIDSLNISINLDNGEDLKLRSFTNRFKSFISKPNIPINIQQTLSEKTITTEQIPVNEKRSDFFRCGFECDKYCSIKYIILKFKVSLSNANKNLKYYQEFKLYPNIEIYYD
jgi:hypothetical protein